MQVEYLSINRTWSALTMFSSGLCSICFIFSAAHTRNILRVSSHSFARSYRRVGGSDFAQLLKVCFQKAGIDVFLDVDNLGQGQFDEQLWKRINAAKNVVLVWTKGCEWCILLC